jgi:hypothetical protein
MSRTISRSAVGHQTRKEEQKKKKNSVNFRFKQIVVKVGWDFEGGCFLPVVVKL